MSRRRHPLVVCVLVGVVCLGPGALAGTAQQRTPSERETRREAVRACGFNNWSACFDWAERNWDRLAKMSLTALMPRRAFVRDGTFAHLDAVSFYALSGMLERGGGGASLCGPGKKTPQDVAVMTCAASRQLAQQGRDRFQQEFERFDKYRQQLVTAGCLPATPADACALVKTTVADGEESDELGLILDERPLQPLVDRH